MTTLHALTTKARAVQADSGSTEAFEGLEIKADIVPTLAFLERAFKQDLEGMRARLQSSGALILRYKQIEHCLEWPHNVPNSLRSAPCILVCDLRTKHVAKLLAYRNMVSQEENIVICVLMLNGDDISEYQNRWGSTVIVL